MSTYNIIESTIKQCKKGDTASQFSIYNRFCKSVYSTSLRIVKNEHQAEDIVQETFLQAFANIKNYKFDVPFEAWIKRIAINKSIDFWRKNQRQMEQLSLWTPDIDDDNNTDDNEEVDWNIERMKRALLQLSDTQRIAISLFYFEEYTHEAVAKSMNISSSNSRILVLRAKQKLKALLLKNNDKSKTNDD